MKKLVIAILISSVAVSGVELASAKSGRGRAQPSASPELSPSASPDASPDASVEPVRSPNPGDEPPGRHCRRNSKRKPRGRCPEKKMKASPSPDANPEVEPSESPTLEDDGSTGDENRAGRRCRRKGKRDGRTNCAARHRNGGRDPSPTPFRNATPTAEPL